MSERRRAQAPRPPGPRLVPGLIQLRLFFRDPMRYYQNLQQRYGPVFRITSPGFAPFVYVTTPELAHEIYGTDGGIGNAAETRQVIEVAVGPNSLLRLEDEPWKRHRKLINPVFHGRAVAAYGDEIAQIAGQEIDSWSYGEPFSLRPCMSNITLEVILRLVFGVRDRNRQDRLRVLLAELVDASGSNLILAVPPPLVMRVGRSAVLQRLSSEARRFFAIRQEVDAILYEEIAQRRSDPVPDATDVLSRLLAARDDNGEPMTDAELRDELMTFLVAGHETTATGLAWTFERLLRSPRVLATLRTDLDAGEERYVQAVAKESLRSRPVVYAAPRALTAPLRLGDYEVPAGWHVSPMIPLVHRDPVAFPDPDEFRPERFLVEGPGDEAAREKAQHGWMPFGGGRRFCIGAQLALLEMRVIIREVLQRVDLYVTDLVPEAAMPKHVTLVPERLTHVVAQARSASAVEAR